jgi:hypothetical protein
MRVIAFITDPPTIHDILVHLAASRRHHPGSRPPAARRYRTCPMPQRVASTPMPSRHRSTSSINASLGNAERRPPFAHDAGQAHADSHQARSLTLAKRPMPGNHGVAATPDHPSSRRPAQVKPCYATLDGASRRWIYYPFAEIRQGRSDRCS